MIDSLKETETEIEENTFNILIWFSENETGNWSAPLHWVATLGNHYEMAKLFIEQYPAASKLMTDYG